MTVKELIEKLKECEQSVEVCMLIDMFDEVLGVTRESISVDEIQEEEGRVYIK